MTNEAIYSTVKVLAAEDAAVLEERDRSYGSSWEKRGGVGAYMMLARKIDRIEKQVEKHGWDVFKAVEADPSPTGIIDDIRDLRRYLLLVEARLTLNGVFSEEGPKYPYTPTDLDHAINKLKEKTGDFKRIYGGDAAPRVPKYEFPTSNESTYRPEDAARALATPAGHGRTVTINELEDGA